MIYFLYSLPGRYSGMYAALIEVFWLLEFVEAFSSVCLLIRAHYRNQGYSEAPAQGSQRSSTRAVAK